MTDQNRSMKDVHLAAPSGDVPDGVHSGDGGVSGPRAGGSAHTPGPWLLTEDGSAFVYALNERGVNRFDANVQPGYDDSGRRTRPLELLANARLIAAAPELLAALQLLHDDIAEYARINHLGGFDNHCVRFARAAIAKALGQVAPTPGAPTVSPASKASEPDEQPSSGESR